MILAELVYFRAKTYQQKAPSRPISLDHINEKEDQDGHEIQRP
jgi:hypothetical protein